MLCCAVQYYYSITSGKYRAAAPRPGAVGQSSFPNVLCSMCCLLYE